MRIAPLLIALDRACNRVPFISTIANAINLLFKWRSPPIPHYRSYLARKPVSICIVLLIPIAGNIFIYIADKKQKKREQKRDANKLAQFYRTTTKMIKELSLSLLKAAKKQDSDAMLAASLQIGSAVIKSYLYTLVWPRSGRKIEKIGRLPVALQAGKEFNQAIRELLKSLKAEAKGRSLPHLDKTLDALRCLKRAAITK